MQEEEERGERLRERRINGAARVEGVWLYLCIPPALLLGKTKAEYVLA